MVKLTLAEKEVMDMLYCDLKRYEVTITNMTAQERKELYEWVADGSDVHSNPWLLYDEYGLLFDFITASRIADDMLRNPESYFGIGYLEPELNDDIDINNEPPF